MSKKETWSKGMAGVVVSDSSISYVNGAEGVLEYRGYDIRELAEWSSYEEVVFLLWNGRLPHADELEEMKQHARSCRVLPRGVMQLLHDFPRDAEPMAVMRTAISALALYDPDAEDNSPATHERKALRLLGQAATVVAAFCRLRNGLKPVEPRTDLDHAANFLWMLNGEEADPNAVKALDRYLVLLADHDFNASTFAARVTISTVTDLHSAITSALGTLKGPLHGGAVQESMAQFLAIGTVENVEPWFKQLRANGGKVMGIGHRVYKVRDPRAEPLQRTLEAMVEATGERRWYDIAVKLEETATRDPYFQERNLSANVDFYSAPLLYSLGIPMDTFTCMFGISRIAGWTAHIYEQQTNNRLMRPLSNYTGAHQLPWEPLAERRQAVPGWTLPNRTSIPAAATA